MAKKEGYSREGWFGEIIHYDARGHKIGESRPKLFGEGYANYDAKGRKIGESRPSLFGGGYNNYDVNGHKTGSVSPGLFGGQVHYDAKGHRVGTSSPGLTGNSRHYGSLGSPAETVNGAASAWAVQQREERLRTAVEVSAAAALALSGAEKKPGTAPAAAPAQAPAQTPPEEALPDVVWYVIAGRPSTGEHFYFYVGDRTLQVGDRVKGPYSDEVFEVLAVVSCLREDMPTIIREAACAKRV